MVVGWSVPVYHRSVKEEAAPSTSPGVVQDAAAPSLLLLYDGECGLCARSIQWVLERDVRARSMRFAALQGETAAPLLTRHGIAPHPRRGFESLVLVQDVGGTRERVLQRSDAALAIGRYLGGSYGRLARLAGLVPRFLRDLAYGLVARNRLRFFGAADACRVPRGKERERFLP